MDDKIIMTTEEGEELVLFVVEQTRIAGVDYLLAADTEEEDGECYILKDYSKPEDEESRYEILADEKETEYVLGVFKELIEDIDIIY